MSRNYFGVVIAEPRRPWGVTTHQWSLRHMRIRDPLDAPSFVIRFFQVMAQSAIDKIPPGPKLDELTAEKVFGRKNVHTHKGSLVGKKQDKAGHWRLAKVPYYSTNPVHAYLIEGRMKQLGRLDRCQKELSKINHAKNVPFEWATPDQRCRAAIKAMGQYGQVIPLSRSRKQIQK
jgi:hypothetical protein